MFGIPKIPLDVWIENFVTFLTNNLAPLFDWITTVLGGFVEWLVDLLIAVPPWLLIILIVLLAWWLCRWKVALFTVIGLLLIGNLGLWEDTMFTLGLVLTSVLISIIIGIPIGIWSARNNLVMNIVTPILDFMQTMPPFVYLIPAIIFFNLGMVPGIFASVIFATPPTIRLTNLGIRQVSAELVEASDAFGSTPWQKLIKVQLPLSMPTMMAGINQSIMLALSMVVIASMIGAPGLGVGVYGAVTQLEIGVGFEAGLAIVIIAIVLDRISQNIKKSRK